MLLRSLVAGATMLDVFLVIDQNEKTLSHFGQNV